MTDKTDQPQNSNDGDLQGLRIEVPIELAIPDDMRSTFVNHVVVQHSDNEFFLYFFELNPPMLLGTGDGLSDEVVEEIRAKGIKANCVSKIVLSGSFMESVITTLGESYEKYLRKKSASSANEEEDN